MSENALADQLHSLLMKAFDLLPGAQRESSTVGLTGAEREEGLEAELSLMERIDASIDLKMADSRVNVERKIRNLERKFANLKEYTESLVTLCVCHERKKTESEPEVQKDATEKLEKMQHQLNKNEEKESEAIETIERLKRRNSELLEKFVQLHAFFKEALVQMEELLRAKDQMKRTEADKVEFLSKQNHALISQNEGLKIMRLEQEVVHQERHRKNEESQLEQNEQIKKLIRENERLRAEEEELKERCWRLEQTLERIHRVSSEAEEYKMSADRKQNSLPSALQPEMHSSEILKAKEEKTNLNEEESRWKEKMLALSAKEPIQQEKAEEEYGEREEVVVGAPDYAWMISGEKSDEHIRWGQFHSGVFEVRGYGLDAHIHTEPAPPVINIRVQFLSERAVLAPGLLPTLTCILRDRYDIRSMDKRLSLTFPFKVHKYKTMNFAFPSDFFEDSVKNGTQNFYVDYKNRIRVELHVERPEVARAFFSDDGLLLWRISGFDEKKRLAKRQLVDGEFSPYFYTGPRGYRVQLKLQLCQKGRCALGLMFLTGSHDPWLDSSFPHSTEVTVVNQGDPADSLSRRKVCTMEGFNTYFGMILGPMDRIERLVEDDALLLRVEVRQLLSSEGNSIK